MIGFILLGIGLLAYTAYQLYPTLLTGVLGYRAYFTPAWAHDSEVVHILLTTGIALWIVYSSLYLSIWLIHRSMRKLKGKPWRIRFKDERLHFLPNMRAYLKISCIYLAVLWLFVIAQYPLQFLK
ncbi:MAG: hypothetical protein R3240_01410 [Gammaproteobacteria bacterium]|nr:hypothetical protein [Gammaproteobacteria bacterium]